MFAGYPNRNASRPFGLRGVPSFKQKVDDNMAPLPDYLASLVGEDGASLLDPDISAGISSEYDADMAVPTAKIAEMETALAAALADLQATKAANWDLLQTSAAGSADDDTPTDTADSTASSDPDNSENDTEPDTDSFFGDDE